MKLAGVNLRRYKPGDETEIIHLFREVYGYERSMPHWKWKFTENVMKRAPMWVASNEYDQLIAHYAVCPVPLQLGGATVMGAQSLDTMVTTKYQRRRLMTTLARNCYRESREAGIDLIYGYPNERSYSSLVHRLGFSDLGTVNRYELTFSSFAGIASRTSLRKFGPVLSLMNRLDRFIYPDSSEYGFGLTKRTLEYGNDHEALWNKTRGERYGVYRSHEYLNWRYSRFPDYDYLSLSLSAESGKLLGFTIIGLKNNIAYFAELVPIEETTTRILIGTAIRELRTMGISKLVGHFSLWDEESEVLKDLGFVERSSRLVFCIKFLGEEPPEDLYEKNAWYVSFGDTDGI